LLNEKRPDWFGAFFVKSEMLHPAILDCVMTPPNEEDWVVYDVHHIEIIRLKARYISFMERSRLTSGTESS
jgi:hypothetical protein